MGAGRKRPLPRPDGRPREAKRPARDRLHGGHQAVPPPDRVPRDDPTDRANLASGRRRLDTCSPRGRMNRDTARGLLDRLHEAQNDFYAGGSRRCPRAAPRAEHHVDRPGQQSHRRDLPWSRGRARLLPTTTRPRRSHISDEPTSLLVGDGDRIAALTDGFARSATSTIGGQPWAGTTSSINQSQRAGCYRSTSTRLTPSGPPERAWSHSAGFFFNIVPFSSLKRSLDSTRRRSRKARKGRCS